MQKLPTVYIITNNLNGTVYVGVISNIVKRIWEHKNGTYDGFSKRYKLHKLVWYEYRASMEDAIAREKEIKKWKRLWKLKLINEFNPDWNDLYQSHILGGSEFSWNRKTWPKNRLFIFITRKTQQY